MNSKRRALRITVALGFFLGGIAFAQDAPTIAFAERDGKKVIKVAPLTPGATDALDAASPSQREWQQMFPVRVQPASPTQVEQQPNVLGHYVLEKQAVIFTPRYPFSTRVAYDVSFHLPNNNQPYATTLRLSLAEITATQVTRIFPTTDVLPANLLKFYIEFSAPMARGNGFNYVHIEKEDGTKVHDPFPEIGVELWDPEQKRFTVLLDPGRIKRGIRINEEMGLPLVPGNAYRFVVQPEWPDATGQPLAQGV